jgi:hypothetical protein
MSSAVFAAWPAATAERWGREPLQLTHHLHRHPLFELDALGDLIDRYPASDYSLVLSNRQGDGSRRWREGTPGGLPGRAVIDAIAQGSLWLNLREVHRVDPRYGALMEQAYRELAARLPGFSPRACKMGILISSPDIQVHYHCDLPGQLLWQLAGRKTAWVYPPQPPFLQPQALEDIAYTGLEFRLDYQPQFDQHARRFELEPGALLSWPLNSPHRIDNAGALSISVTTEHWTEYNRRSQQVSLANAVLRHRLGIRSSARPLAGPGYWARMALAAAWRRTPWARQVQRAVRPIDFRLSPDAPGGFVDLLHR